MSTNGKSGVVNIRGKEYRTVALRVSEFREKCPDWTISTDLVLADAEKVVMKAAILTPEGVLLGTGYAEEYRESSNINKTSALENCETSAIGRALAACGYAGSEYASADEVANAMKQQDEKAIYARAKQHIDALRDNWDSVAEIRKAIADDDLGYVAQLLDELDQETQIALNLAPTRGGIFTTQERAVLKSDELGKIRREMKKEAANG